MTSAETFLYDPLVDWSAAPKDPAEGGAGGEVAEVVAPVVKVAEIENPAAKDALLTIQGRLSGTLLGVLSQPSLPLSCEGHAQRLIIEATDKEKLGSMYVSMRNSCFQDHRQSFTSDTRDRAGLVASVALAIVL